MQEAAPRLTTIEEFESSTRDGYADSRTSREAKGPLPLVVGIVGHRDILAEDSPKLEAKFRQQISTLQTQYPNTEIIVISALADGADRVGARVALASGVRLVVPMPMPRELYLADFNPSSRIEFDALLAKAEHWFELPILSGLTAEDIATPGQNRDHQYAQVGAYIAMHSELLVAFWNGVPTSLEGGTAQVVEFKLHGVPVPFAPPHSELDAPDSGVVIHIVTRRESEKETRGELFHVEWVYPPGFDKVAEAERAYADIYSRMEGLNQDAVSHKKLLKEGSPKSLGYLFPLEEQRVRTPMLEQTAEFYSIADVLSQYFQKRTLTAFRVILVLVFLAALSYDLYSHVFEEEWILSMYLVMFFFSFLWHTRVAKAGFQTKYLDYRALAEGLRVQFFWRIAGISDSVADFYMREQKSELDWVRNAVRSSMTETIGDPGLRSTQELPLRERLILVSKYWVEDQERYFAKAAHRDHERLHKNEKRITQLFGLSLLAAAIQLLLPANPVFIIAIGLLPVIAALIHTFLQKNALMEHSKQYERMSVLFRRARIHLDKLIAEDRWSEAQSLVAEIGKEALSENGDWIMTHRERPLEVPKGA
jgi:hypothetical protein